VYSCNLCGKRFQHHGTLSVHQRTHILESGKSDFKCDICGKVCTAKRYLDIHTYIRFLAGVNSHVNDELRISCKSCVANIALVQLFTQMHSFVYYQVLFARKFFTTNRTTNFRPHQCECGKGFTDKFNLTMHTRIHQKDKAHVCEICGKGFVQNTHLRVSLICL
jgi:KRAB domain-containing zinc finger protein